MLDDLPVLCLSVDIANKVRVRVLILHLQTGASRFTCAGLLILSLYDDDDTNTISRTKANNTRNVQSNSGLMANFKKMFFFLSTKDTYFQCLQLSISFYSLRCALYFFRARSIPVARAQKHQTCLNKKGKQMKMWLRADKFGRGEYARTDQVQGAAGDVYLRSCCDQAGTV